MANMKDVAEKAGVSIATVSHVINETRFVREETREKVKKTMKELNYYPNSAARTLRKRKSNIIAFLVPDISNFFFTALACKIESLLKKDGYNIVFGNTDENIESEIEHLKIMNSYAIDGLIIAPTWGDQSYLKNYNKKFPIVFIDRKPTKFEGDCVLVDNKKASVNAINHLIKKGHSKIGIITGLPKLTSTVERLEGYKEAFKNNNLKYNNTWIAVGDSRYESGYELTKKLLQNHELTALFVTNNLMSIGAMEYIKQNDIKVPEDIAIIGFDDYKWASITNPPLSVIKQPVEEIGEKAVSLILDKIEREKDGISDESKEENICRLKTELKIRESC